MCWWVARSDHGARRSASTVSVYFPGAGRDQSFALPGSALVATRSPFAFRRVEVPVVYAYGAIPLDASGVDSIRTISAPARPWLYGIARRVLANHYRGARRRSALSDRLRADLAASCRPVERDDDLTAVAEALRALPDDDRELLSLVGWEGLDRAHGHGARLFAQRRPHPAAPGAQAVRPRAGVPRGPRGSP